MKILLHRFSWQLLSKCFNHAMKHVIRCIVKPAWVFQVFKMGLLVQRYFYQLIYVAKIRYCAMLKLRCWDMTTRGKMNTWWTLRGNTNWKQMRYSAKFILGQELKISNFLEAFLGTNCNWLHGFFMLLFAHHVNSICTVIAYFVLYISIYQIPFGCCPYVIGITNITMYFASGWKKMCHRGFGFITLSDEISVEYTSQKVHRIHGQTGVCYHDIW